jgi:hypothetical protein
MTSFRWGCFVSASRLINASARRSTDAGRKDAKNCGVVHTSVIPVRLGTSETGASGSISHLVSRQREAFGRKEGRRCPGYVTLTLLRCLWLRVHVYRVPLRFVFRNPDAKTVVTISDARTNKLTRLQCSLVGVTIGYGLDDRRTTVRVPVIFHFPRRPDRILGSIQPPVLCVQGTLSLG